MIPVRKILILTAVAILLLHVLIPHRHHGDMTAEEDRVVHQEATRWLDFIGLAFHQGSATESEVTVDGFEEVLKQGSFKKTPSPVKLSLSIESRPWSCSTNLAVFRSSKLVKSLWFVYSELRGPPIFDYNL